MEKIAIQREIESLVERVMKEHNLKPYDIETFYIIKEKYGDYLKKKYPKSDVEYWIESVVKDCIS